MCFSSFNPSADLARVPACRWCLAHHHRRWPVPLCRTPAPKLAATSPPNPANQTQRHVPGGLRHSMPIACRAQNGIARLALALGGHLGQPEIFFSHRFSAPPLASANESPCGCAASSMPPMPLETMPGVWSRKRPGIVSKPFGSEFPAPASNGLTPNAGTVNCGRFAPRCGAKASSTSTTARGGPANAWLPSSGPERLASGGLGVS